MSCMQCLSQCAGLVCGSDQGGTKRAPAVYNSVMEAIMKTSTSAESFSKSSLLLHYDPTRSFNKHYKQGGKIGEGGFGAVFRCQHTATKDLRACKVIQKTQVKKDMEFVLIEIEALLILDHPNVVKIYEFFEQPASILVVVELCTAGDFAALQRADISMEEIRPLLRDVTLGLAYCHELSIVHRDLKFENCLLCEGSKRKIAKVIDFGLSAIKHDVELDEDGSPRNPDVAWLSEALGTRFFAAPEVIDRHIKYGSKCDMWSLGVMIYIMFTNEHPFAKNALRMPAQELFVHVLNGRYRREPLFAAEVPVTARVLLKELLIKEPCHRISAVQALEHAWLRPEWSAELAVKTAITNDKSEKMASSLGSWFETSHFEKVVLMMVGHRAKLKEVEDMRAAFIALDTDGNGWLSRMELDEGLKTLGHIMRESDFAHMYSWLDSNQNSKLDYSEWLCATMEPSMIAAESAVLELFDYFDSDADGVVSRDELNRVISDSEALEVLSSYDTSNDGYIDHKEFKVLMERIAMERAKAVNSSR